MLRLPRLDSGRNQASMFPAREHYRCLRNKCPSSPYEFIGLGAMDFTKTNKFKLVGDIHGLKPYKFIGFRWAFISQTPVLRNIG